MPKKSKPKCPKNTKMIGWDILTVHGEEALFKRTYRGQYGKKVIFRKRSGTVFNKIYACLIK